jgi:hypothetical protein
MGEGFRELRQMKQKCVVKIHYGAYEGTETVYCDENDEIDVIIAQAFRQAKCDFLAMAYTSAKIISREDLDK